MTPSSRDDWARFTPEDIPTKTDLTELELWLGDHGRGAASALDVGCGAGAVSRSLTEKGLKVVGCDINAEAIEQARVAAPEARFYVRDIASARGFELAEAPFDLVVCQLVLSVVGGKHDRERLLSNIRDSLRPGGWVYLSASGVSDAINPGYARLYEEDFPETGERHTYFSRDSAGKILYRTHHFTEDELGELLRSAGLAKVAIRSKRESSSRRPDEAAFFLYGSAQRSLRSSE